MIIIFQDPYPLLYIPTKLLHVSLLYLTQGNKLKFHMRKMKDWHVALVCTSTTQITLYKLNII